MKLRSVVSLKRLAAGFLVLALALAACAAGEVALTGGTTGESVDEEGGLAFFGRDSSQNSPPTTAAATTSSPDEKDAAGTLNAANPPVVLNIVDFGRDIIFTADMTVAVGDVSAAGNDAIRIVQGLGGYLFGQSTQGSPNPRSVLTFKVAPSDFQETLSRLGALGDVRTQEISASDVTDRIVDLESQIATASASVERLRALLAQATEIKAIVELENELLARETQLESMRGQLRTLQNQVALATIVVTLTEAESRPAIDVVMTAYPGHDDGVSCPGDSEPVIEQDTEATVCFEIFNSGDTRLTGVELKDPVLDIETKHLISVYGDPAMVIEPGQSIVVAAEVLVQRPLRTRTTVTAQPVDEDGAPLTGRAATQTTSVYINAVDPGGIASFSDGLKASWDWLVAFGQVLLLGLGAAIPFFWVPLVLWLVWRMLRVRRRERVTTARSTEAS